MILLALAPETRDIFLESRLTHRMLWELARVEDEFF